MNDYEPPPAPPPPVVTPEMLAAGLAAQAAGGHPVVNMVSVYRAMYIHRPLSEGPR